MIFVTAKACPRLKKVAGGVPKTLDSLKDIV